MNLVCAIELALRKDWNRIGRLTAFNALAAVPVIQWMLPSVPQIMSWLREEQPAYVTDVWQWLHDLGAVLMVGWQWDNPWREMHVGTDWKGVAPHFPLPPGVTVGVVAGLCITGLLLAGRRGAAARIIIMAPVIAALISLAVNLRPGSPMTVWYLIYLLIPATLAVPLALEGNVRDERLRLFSQALCVGFILFYGFGTRSAVAALREHDRQPIRQTVAFIHSQAKNAMTATFGVSDRQHAAYDPHVVVLESEADLDRCIAQARSASIPFYVYFCSEDQAQKRRPQIYERLAKSGDFERLKEFPGSEELWSYRVYQLKPAP
jgi:hypothetical protein